MQAARTVNPWWKRMLGAPRTITAGAAASQVRVVPWGVGTSPGRVTVKAGRPITLVFEREGSWASELVTIPSLGWVSTLGHTRRSSVELAPCAAGAYHFSSLDGGRRGCLVVEP